VAHVQALVSKRSAELKGKGRAAIAITGATTGVNPAQMQTRQAARFGSRGEDFSSVNQLP
jgi:hypothetical protein